MTQNVSIEPEMNSAVGTARLVAYGLAALVVACLVNVLITLLSVTALEFPRAFVGGPFGPLAVGPVVVNSAIAVVGATVVYGVVPRYSVRPNRTFVFVAVGVLVLSFAMLLSPTLAGAPPRVYAVLAVLHVSTALVVVGVLTRAQSGEVASR